MNRIYVRDDQGYLWFIEDGRLRLLASDDNPENGYPCQDWNQGVQMLNDMGYITYEGDD